MKCLLATVEAARKASDASKLRDAYVKLAGRYVEVEYRNFASEAALLSYVQDNKGRTKPCLWIMDSQGESVSSEELAGAFRQQQDGGVQTLVLAVGPPNGWSAAARTRAEFAVAFGRITLPHELAAVVMAEQLYRVLAILAGHPYHKGH